MASVLDQAQNFSGGPIAAARKRDRWALEEANATDPERREALREAIADLEARYSDLADVPIGGAEAFARERGHGKGARSPVHGGRHRSGSRSRSTSPATPRRKSTPKTPAAASGRKPVPGLDPGARRSPAQKRASQGRPTPRVDRAIRQTGIPSSLSSSGSTLMAGLGATVGLALLFLLLSSAETPGSGAAALPSLIGSVTRGLGRFLSLEDVFPSSGVKTGAVAGAQPVRTVATQAEVSRVLGESGRFPGEVGAGGGGKTLSNPAAELQPRTRPNPRNRHRRGAHSHH